MRNLLTLIPLSAALLPAAVISDGVFANPDWTASTVSLAGASGETHTITQVPSGGNPNEYRGDVHTLTSNNGSYTSLTIFNRFNSAYLTLNTAITSLSYAYELKLDSVISPLVGYRPALEQNGIVYHTVAAHVANSSTWNGVSMSGLTAASFCRATPGFSSGTITWDCAQNPNFSAGASDIFVGYVIANSYTAPSGVTVNYASGLDNFQVNTAGATTVTPEPGTLAVTLLGAGLTWLGSRRRRR